MVSKKKQVKEEHPEEVIESAINRTEFFIQKNGKTLLTILIVIVVIAGGLAGYRYLHKVPRQNKAAAAIFPAQNLFAADSLAAALNGDGNNMGFLDVIQTYGSTESGNLAKHYAGQCYLRMGDYDNAIKYFGMYKDVKGISAKLVNAMNAGLTGDAYVQKGDLDKGVSFYSKAVSASDDLLTTSYYLFKSGQIYQKQGNNAKALEAYKTIKQKYPRSQEASEIDKYIAQLEQAL